MQPTANNPDPSSVEPATDAAATTETPPDPNAQPSRVTSFFQRLWRGRDGRFTGGGEDVQTEEDARPSETVRTITLTQEELDRRVDAETQRREAKRAQAAEAERRRKLRDEDPWAFAEEARNAEHAAQFDQQTNTWLSDLGATHDRVSIDPLVLSLPKAEQDRILALEGAGIGLEGRKLIVNESLKALEKLWKAEGARDAEDKLRRNPAFRKQVLSEFRHGMREPEFIGSGNGVSSSDASVSDILRQQIRARHQ